MPTNGTTHRTVRIEDGLWNAVRAKAEEEGRNASDVIRELLAAWVEQSDTPG